jgi:predicted SAM-dependent methyltransferase
MNDFIKLNLCCGSVKLPGFVNVDFLDADIIVDLELDLLPFPDSSVDTLVCISAINYFSRERAQQILNDMHRVLRPGGVLRIGVQDLQVLARKYLERDTDFWFEKRADGSDRYPGATFAEKFTAFFDGFPIADKRCKSLYDFETLGRMVLAAGFGAAEQRSFLDSRIVGIEQIDNRPEQMFFLEAVKGAQGGVTDRPLAAAALWNHASTLWNEGKHRQGWQAILKSLDLDGASFARAAQASQIMLSQGRYTDAAKLWGDFLALAPGHTDATSIAAHLQNEVAVRQTERVQGGLSPEEALAQYGRHDNSIQTDDLHLRAAIDWMSLAQARSATADGGVSAIYWLRERRWDVSYPETTGYIIPTFLAFHRITGEARWLEEARRMGEWELDIQAIDGGAGEPLGIYIKRPRVFNSSQVMLGWMALYRTTGEGRYLEAAIRAGNWIAGLLDEDGKWTEYTYAGPKTHKARVAWALLELHLLTGNPAYRQAADRATNWVTRQATANGWFANTSLSDPDKPWTHLIGYTLVGLTEICRLRADPALNAPVLAILRAAADNIVTPYLRQKGEDVVKPYRGLPGTYDPEWNSTDGWSCVTGNAQIAFFLRRLSAMTASAPYGWVADMLIDELKRVQLIDGIADENIRGGLPGPDPAGFGYLADAIPNWGVKFFADALLQRRFPNDPLYCLG